MFTYMTARQILRINAVYLSVFGVGPISAKRCSYFNVLEVLWT